MPTGGGRCQQVPDHHQISIGQSITDSVYTLYEKVLSSIIFNNLWTYKHLVEFFKETNVNGYE